MRALQAWERYWFSEIPPEAYALLRIAVGILGLISLLGVTPVAMYWPLDGITPLPSEGIALRGLIHGIGLGTVAGWTLFVVLAVAFVCLTVGYFSGVAVIVCFVGSVFQYYWNHLPLSSALQVQIVVLFCLVWADCGAALSLDFWLRRKTGLTEAQPMWPLRLIRVQVALVYLNSGLWKLFGPPWRDGTAITYALNNNIFHRFPLTVPEGFEWIATVSTYVTLFWEIGFVLMLLHPWTRRLALLAGIGIHVGVWVTMEVGPFSPLMLASYIAFLDPHAVAVSVRRRLQPLGARLPTRHRVVSPTVGG